MLMLLYLSPFKHNLRDTKIPFKIVKLFFCLQALFPIPRHVPLVDRFN